MQTGRLPGHAAAGSPDRSLPFRPGRGVRRHDGVGEVGFQRGHDVVQQRQQHLARHVGEPPQLAGAIGVALAQAIDAGPTTRAERLELGRAAAPRSARTRQQPLRALRRQRRDVLGGVASQQQLHPALEGLERRPRLVQQGARVPRAGHLAQGQQHHRPVRQHPLAARGVDQGS